MFHCCINYDALMCFNCRYLVQNMDWLEQSLGDFDDDYVLFDCPGENLCLVKQYLADKLVYQFKIMLIHVYQL